MLQEKKIVYLLFEMFWRTKHVINLNKTKQKCPW